MKTIPLLAATLLSSSCASAPETPAVPDSVDPRFAWFQRLSGTWIATEESSLPGAEVDYRLIGGGNVLLETALPGTEQETVTAIHRGGGDLLLTRYCALGNQPHMRAVAAEPEPAAEPTPENRASVDFRCQGGANVREDELHMHRAVFTFVGEEHLQTAWTLVDGGELVEVQRMDLVRVGDGPRR